MKRGQRISGAAFWRAINKKTGQAAFKREDVVSVRKQESRLTILCYVFFGALLKSSGLEVCVRESRAVGLGFLITCST